MESHIAKIRLTSYNKDVYEPSDDSFALVDALINLFRDRDSRDCPRVAVEIGSGSGYVVCSLALLLHQLKATAQLFATDISTHCAAATQQTLFSHQVFSVDIILSDLVTVLQPRIDGLVDLLLFNPPYVPTPDEEVGTRNIAAAWAGGNRGRRVIDRLLPRLSQLLSPKGEVLMVTVHENEPQEIIRLMEEQGFEGRVVLQRGADEEVLSVLHFKRQ